MFQQAFPIVIISENFDGKHAAGRAVRQLADALGEQGFRVVTGVGYHDARRLARIYHNESSLLISVDDAEAVNGQWAALEDLLTVTRRRNTRLPIFLLGDERSVESVPTDVLKHTQAFFQLHEDSPEHLARAIGQSAQLYLEKLLPPMFKALSEHAQRGPDAWPTSGHGGGVAFRKSPVGRVFYEFFGENIVRADLPRPRVELGSPVSTTGAVAAAQRNAARIFGSDRTLFIAGGPDVCNRIIWQGTVGRDDCVVCDRSGDLSFLHAMIQTGAVPIYLQPTRNALGLLGPVTRDQLTPQWIQHKLAAASHLGSGRSRARLLAMTNSTPDGICYNVDAVKSAVGEAVDVLHFDERWLGYAGFHEFYSSHHAMASASASPRRARGAITWATQSTHTTLAALAPGSMLHCLDGATSQPGIAPIEHAVAMHSSQAPQYAVLASCDVAAAMMEQPAGRAIVEETIDEALAFRRAVAAVRRTSPGSWWFGLWQPPALADYPVAEPSRWRFNPSDRWHGFGSALPEDVLLDPVKVTLLTPGHRGDERGTANGIPAAVVTAFLAARRIDVSRSGLHSFVITFSTGIPEGRWSTLITELLNFRDSYERNAPLRDVLPHLVTQHAAVYAALGLKDLCVRVQSACGKLGVAGSADDPYARLPEIGMRPGDAHDQFVRGCVEPVEIDQLVDRIVATPIVQDAPAMPLALPGERITRETLAIQQYLVRARQFETECPGFELGITGVDVDRDAATPRYLVTCLKAKK